MEIKKIREEFPILEREVHGRQLVYLDNAATTQKPLCVLDAMREEYLSVNANVHRGVHYLSQQATELHEAARERVRRFIGAEKADEVVFTRGATEGVNLVASSFVERCMKEGDEVIVSTLEHHSNIVPWQLWAERKGIKLQVIPIGEDCRIDLNAYEQLFSERTRMVSVTHVSNALGVVMPVKRMIKTAHERGIPVLVDAAQSVPHMKIDVRDLDCDFLVFSAHKVYGPTGIGVLYGKEKWLEALPPYMGGGEMIVSVSWDKTTYERPPLKFEAGTPDYVASHGLATALDFVDNIGMDNICAHERDLTSYAVERLREVEGLRMFGVTQEYEPTEHDAIVSFLLYNGENPIHHLDVGTLLDQLGIAVRTGHHCAQPLMTELGVLGTVRASFALYNTREEVDTLVDGLKRVRRMF